MSANIFGVFVDNSFISCPEGPLHAERILRDEALHLGNKLILINCSVWVPGQCVCVT